MSQRLPVTRWMAGSHGEEGGHWGLEMKEPKLVVLTQLAAIAWCQGQIPFSLWTFWSLSFAEMILSLGLGAVMCEK